jgi:hypothetical protein
VFLLTMLADDRTRIRQPKLRWAKRGKGPTFLMAFDPDTEAFSYVGEESDAERDYVAEITELLNDGTWHTVKEIAAKKDDGGIGASDTIVKKILDTHPDVFEALYRPRAVEVGRHPSAIVWQLRNRPAAELANAALLSSRDRSAAP